MSDPVLTLILLVFFFAAVAAARFFRTLQSEFGTVVRASLPVGVGCGVVLVLIDRYTTLHAPLIAVVLTVAAIWVRHNGDESEPASGMLLGALTGAAAAIAAAFSGSNEALWFSELTLAGAIAGYGITLAAFHAADRTRQIAIDAGTAVAAGVAAAVPSLLERVGVAARVTAISVTALIPLITILTVFYHWREVRGELAHEASLGFMSEDDVRATAHPLLRLGRGGWTDADAHREFVRIANRIALRKRQQRSRSESVARLHQLEIMKLRMQLQEMTSIDRTMRAQAASPAGEDAPSDRMQA